MKELKGVLTRVQADQLPLKKEILQETPQSVKDKTRNLTKEHLGGGAEDQE